ncbi:cation:proton antiporter [Arundinibacter roseus]|uniref:Cation/H+ exchanger transmembrane domain-containing protein n=1 Tax=Arundinibacter roseus TaxID=2070510 RepID=A0A4R4KFT5_9BACT|nr:cation:proton antiporter [Arundinibacter roseus]TDB66850.1 hypothetical protein EZE20_06920 [Arundinibacter roseus]
MELHILVNIFILLAATVVVVYICNFFKIPHLIGYLFSGILLSPKTLNLVDEATEVEAYAEIGVILLLFSVGLEFSFSNLRKIQRYVLLGGFLQVILTILVTTVLIVLMGRSLNQSIFWGFVTCLSSTAIVVKTMQDKFQLNTPHGKVILAMLLFQDIVIVPLMLLTPILAGKGDNPLLQIGLLLLKLASMGLLAWLLAKYIIPRYFKYIMKLQSQEIFLLSTIVIILGIALFTAQLGLSLALGAFVAGLIVAETDYNKMAISCFVPFRYLFISFFFISMGMLLDYHIFLEHLDLILFWFVFIIFVKTLAGFLASIALKVTRRTALAVGLSIAQIGEFSFVLSKSGLEYGLISETNYQIFLSVSILTMILTPFILNNLDALLNKFAKLSWLKATN